MSKTTFLVCAHKEFDCGLSNPVYKILCGKEDEISPKDVEMIRIEPYISNIGFSEWQKFYAWWKDGEKSDYIGLMHYRRILKLGKDINDIPPMEELFKDCDMIVGMVIFVDSVWNQYARCHNIKDLQDCKEIIESDFPEYKEAFDAMMENNLFFICNNVIMRYEDFNDFCEFLFGVLFKWCERNGVNPKSDESFYNYIDADIKNYSKIYRPEDVTFREQARIGGFLSERLFNVWAVKKGLRLKSAPVVNSK